MTKNFKLKRLADNKHLLYVLQKAKPKFRKAILQNANTDAIKALIEIVYNTLNGNNKINEKDKKYFGKYKKEMRCLSCPKRSLTSKRKLLIQKGGFLPTLLATIFSGIIGKIIENA